MKKVKNVSAIILCLLFCWGGVLTSCSDNADPEKNNIGSEKDNTGSEKNEYITDDVYAPGFYSTKYEISWVRDVYRTPSMPSEGDTSLNVYNPGNPYLPDYDRVNYSDDELKNIKYFVLRQSDQEDRYDEYAVSIDGNETKIGTNGRIMCFGKEGFLYLCGGSSGTYYGTFFFTKYGYKKFAENDYDMTYDFYKLNLGHADVSEIFGSAN